MFETGKKEYAEMDCFKAELGTKEFKLLSDYIYSEFGIKMPEAKRVMLQGRLLKRIRELSMKSYTEYCDYLFSDEGQSKELYSFLSVVTTNKTDFFREPVHFDFLRQNVLPEYSASQNGVLKVWSAGCSSGEEPYTVSVVLNEYKRLNPSFNFSIFGTDISANVLQKAAQGVYAENKIDIVPLELKKRYFLRSKDRTTATVRVAPILQQNLSLKYLNLMDANYDVQEKFDIIFCRNVLIYFDRNTQEQVINKLCRHLKPGGIFFIGHSESLSSMTVPLQHIKPTIFKKI